MRPKYLSPASPLVSGSTGIRPPSPAHRRDESLLLERRVREAADLIAEELNGFVSLYLVEQRPAEPRAVFPWLRFVLFAREPMGAVSRFALRAALARHLEGAEVEVTVIETGRIRERLLSTRAGVDLLFGGRRLAGRDLSPFLDPKEAGGPLPAAALNELGEVWRLLLLTWPEPQLLVDDGLLPEDEARDTLLLAQWQAARKLADAHLLSSGAYRPDSTAKIRALQGDASLPLECAKIFHWGSQEDFTHPPMPAGKSLWFALRRTALRVLRRLLSIGPARGPRALRRLRDRAHPPQRALLRRVLLALRGAVPDWEGELRAVQLGLVLAMDESEDPNRALVLDAWRSLTDLGGPMLVHPSWHEVRREALALRPRREVFPPAFRDRA